MKFAASFFATLSFLLTSGLAFAQTDWPNFMWTLMPGRPAFPSAALTSVDTVVEQPGSEVSAEKAKWLGRWAGYACKDEVCDAKLLVDKVSNVGASIVFAVSGQIRPLGTRVEAKFAGNELQAGLADGGTIVYRMRTDNIVEMKWWRGASWETGVLAKTESFEQSTVPPNVNPFNGTWELIVVGEGSYFGKEFPWNKRVDIEGTAGVMYPERPNDAGTVCLKLRKPISDVEFTESTITFTAMGSKTLGDCEDYLLFFRRRGSEVVGFARIFNPDGSVWGVRRLRLVKH